MKRNIFALIFIILFLPSCQGQNGPTQEQLACFQSTTETNKNTELVETIKKQLHSTIQSWIDAKVHLAQRYKITTWRIDDAIFFNTTKDKAILLILKQDTSENAKMDIIEMIYAKRVEDTWYFYSGGMPSLTAMRYYEKQQPEIPYTFNELSEMAVRKIIEGGYLISNSCEVNDDYIEGWDKNLESQHERFLNNKKQ